jgi:HK97 family phage prohead protease
MTTEAPEKNQAVGTTLPPPRIGLFRASAGLELREEGTGMPKLTGYMLRFDEATEINSMFEGNFIERIAPGATKKTLRENAHSLQILFNHGKDPSIGQKPLTEPAFIEDSRGVRYDEPELFDTTYCRDLVPALKSGRLGSSFQFDAVKEEIVEPTEATAENPKMLPERTVTELKLYEGGPVVFPAYAGSSAGARSVTDEFRSHSPQELEELFERWVDLNPEKVRELLEREERKAIAYKKTATSEASWDGPKVKAEIPDDAKAATLRQFFAWEDPEADANTKAAYKFVHHEISNGSAGAANLTACSAGIAVLNGGRGGTTIPAADRQGVYDHLAAHLKDGGKEPPALRSLDNLEEEPSTDAPSEETETTDTGRSDALHGAENAHSAWSRKASKATPPWRQDTKPRPPWHSGKE